MNTDEHLLIVGASARAAAFSALRAGLRPWCADLFGDADLRAHCPVEVMPAGQYPKGFVPLVRAAPLGPWMYTGALENRPELVRRLSQLRPLWGNGADVLSEVRAPARLAAVCRAASVPCPQVCTDAWRPPARGRWLVKPVASAGGAGIRFWDERRTAPKRTGSVYFQEFVEGDSCAALFVGDGHRAELLGVTRQLVGESWLHAAPFRYCGSVGPLTLSTSVRHAFASLGTALAEGFRLRGLFGVDAVLRDGVPWPVEVNPRYTASVEVLEYATGLCALAQHCRAFGAPVTDQPATHKPSNRVVGKAILFARAPVVIPKDGPWMTTLLQPGGVDELPAFADIPAAGTRIPTGRPILTFFAAANDSAACAAQLRETACVLDRLLHGA